MFNEKPPILSGDGQKDLAALRDYLFRMAGSLQEVVEAPAAVTVKMDAKGRQVVTPGSSGQADVDLIRQNAEELKALIIKAANDVTIQTEAYTDDAVSGFGETYVAKSEYGSFTETINSRIEAAARGVVESYDYQALIESAQDSINLFQQYITSINGEIRRGIVLDPSTNTYVTGIAIAQTLSFTGECGPENPLNPGDGYTYYFMTQGQTFGLYTSTGWQFWIDGYKKGWFNSVDGMLHISNVYIENSLQFGYQWRITFGPQKMEIKYIGG